MATIDNAFGKGVVYTAGIDLGAQKPLDSRIAVQTISERDEHVTSNRAYPGMQVYVADENKTYIYNGTEWVTLVTNEDLTEGIDIKVPVATTGTAGGVLAGDDISVDGTGNVTVNQASKLREARTITLQGDASGTFSFDGSSDASVDVDVAGLDNKVNITGQTGEVDLTSATVRVKTLSKSEAQSDAGTAAASIQFVSDVVDARIAQSDAMIYKGLADDKTDISNVNTTAKTGWTFRVTADLDFTDDDYIVSDVKVAHSGDLIICRTDGSEETPATWDIVKHNDQGQVIGPESSVAGRIAVFNDATGKVIADGGKSIDEVKAEAVSTVVGTSGDASSSDTVYGAKKYADEKVAAAAITSGTVTPGQAADSVSISGNSITISLRDYALTSDVDSDIAAAKTELIGSDADTSSSNTIYGAKKYADDKASTINSSITSLENRVATNEGKLTGIDGTVAEAISTGVTDGITAAITTDGAIDDAIDAKIAQLDTTAAYTSEELTDGMTGWFDN